MEIDLKDILYIVKQKAMVFLWGRTRSHTKASGKKTNVMVKGFNSGSIMKNMKVNGYSIKNMGTVR